MGLFGKSKRKQEYEAAEAAMARISAVAAEQQRLGQVGIPGRATIVAIYENVEWAANMHWHEVHMDVRVPDRDEYRATRKVALALASMPEFRPGFEVPVLVDPDDRDVVLITQRLS
jgi:hypothetical protein